MTTVAEPHPHIVRSGTLAYLGAAASLFVCFWKATFGFIAPVIGLSVIDINPHLQAIIMWGFAAVTVAALIIDRKQHGENTPLILGAVALAIIMATLYTFYHVVILATGYVLLLIAAFLSQNLKLAFLNRRVRRWIPSPW